MRFHNKSILLVAFLGLNTVALADPSIELKSKIRERFLAAQEEDSAFYNKDAVAAKKALTERGYTVRGSTEMVLLSGSCSIGGCNYTYLLTTEYSNGVPGVFRRQTGVVAGVMRYFSHFHMTKFVKILEEKTLADLER